MPEGAKVYAVVNGRRVSDMYYTWSDVEREVKGYRRAVHKSFPSEQEAMNWLLNRMYGRDAEPGSPPIDYEVPVQGSHQNNDASNPLNPALASCFAGHHESVLRSHLSRTAQNSAQHLLPHIKPGMKILDIGCGPGTISYSFGALVGPEGNVTGIDASEDVINQASNDNREHTNVSFEVGDAANLRFEDSSFDIVHAHQVLQHVHDPLAILKEMRRLVKKSGGIISLREGDLSGTSMYPDPKSLYPHWIQVYMQTARASGADPQTGRKLHVLLRKAGFRKEEVQVKAGSTTYGVNNPDEAKWWGDSWADRCLKSGFYDNALKGGHATKEELQNFSNMWREWGQSEDAWWAMLQGEAICIVNS